MLPRRNPLDEDERLTLQKARRQARSGPSLAPALAGQLNAGQAGMVDVDGNFQRFSLTDIDSADDFYTS